MRQWLKTLFEQQYLPAVNALQDTPQDHATAQKWFDWMQHQWVEHGLTTLRQQAGVLQEVRNALKAIDPHHIALESMQFSPAQWTAINEISQKAVAQRNQQVKLIDNPEAIVATAVRLLESRNWATVAAGLTVLTGRRSSEILATAQFEKLSQWSVRFTGALKRKGEARPLSFEIPTLTTAERVILALEKLRRWVDCQGLSVRQINAKYSHAVATACDKHFAHLVPVRAGKDNLYTHLFRSVYGAIAVFWYCPPTVDADEFKAQIQGHFALLDAEDGELRRSLSAGRHYHDYKIGDGKGNIDGRQGIKLGRGGITVIEAFAPKQVAQAAHLLEHLPPKRRKQSETKLRVWRADVERWQRCLEQLNITDGNQPHRFGQFLTWVEQQLLQKQEHSAAPIEAQDLPAKESDATAASPIQPPIEPPADPVPLLHDQSTPASKTSSSPDLPQLADALPPEPAAASAPTSVASEQSAPIADQLAAQMLSLTQQMAQLTQVLLTREQAQPTPPAPIPSSPAATEYTPLGLPSAPPKAVPPAATPAPQPQQPSTPTPSKPNRSAAVTFQKVNAAIDHILAYNSSPNRPRAHQIMIGVAALKKVKLNGQLCGQAAWEAVIGKADCPGTRTLEIDAHHRHYGLGLMHNRSRNSISGIPSIQDVANGNWGATTQATGENHYV